MGDEISLENGKIRISLKLSERWMNLYEPVAYRPATVGDWVHLPTIDNVIKLTDDHKCNIGVYHLILRPMIPPIAEWWPKWLNARWLYRCDSITASPVGYREKWYISSYRHPPDYYRETHKYKGWYYDNEQLSMIRSSTPDKDYSRLLLTSKILEISFLPQAIEPLRACFKNPWVDESADC